MSEQPDEATEANPDAEPEAEPEHIDGDDGAQEQEQEAAKPSGPSVEAKLQAADKANRTYMQRLDKIFGKDEARHECPKCNGLGVTWGQNEPPLELVAAEDAEPCEKCNAFGLTLTGSKQPGQETKPCGRCGGRGWHEKILPPAPVAQLPAYAPPVDQPVAGQYVPGRGFVPYGSTEPIPGSLTG